MLGKFISLIRPTKLLWPLACLLAVSVCWIVLNYWKLQEYFSARDQRQRTRQTVGELERERARLLAERAALQGEGFATEKAIRERFLMVKPGEHIIFVEPPEMNQTPPVQSDGTPSNKAKPALPIP